jgi:uncharacterized delta-60 repeat protein
MVLSTLPSRRLTWWLLALLLTLSGLRIAHAQPAFQVNVTPPGPVTISSSPGSSVTLMANAFYPAFSVGTGFAGSSAVVNAIAIQTDGKIIVGGSFTSYNGFSCSNIARLKLDGTLDNQFFNSGFNGTVQTIVAQANGQILVGGSFTAYGGSPCRYIARLNSNGTLDSNFAPTGSGFNGSVNVITVQSNGQLIVGGAFSSYNAISTSYIARLNTDGTRDSGFMPTGTGLDGTVKAIAIQSSNGYLLVGGNFNNYNGTSRKGLLRLTDTGQLDGSFNLPTFGSNTVSSIAVLPSGSILVGGSLFGVTAAPSTGLISVTASGSLTPGFSPGFSGGAISAIVVQGTNAFIGGNISSFGSPIIRIDGATGTRDSNFVAPLDGDAYAIAVQTDGKVLTGGSFSNYMAPTTSRNRIVRLTTTGALDNNLVPVSGATYTWSPFGFGSTLLVTSGGSYTATATTIVNGQSVSATSEPVMVNVAPVVVVSPSPNPTPIFSGFNSPFSSLIIRPNAVGFLTGNISVLDRVLVEAGGTLILGSYQILPAASSPFGPPTTSRFELQAGATLSIGHPDGIAKTGFSGAVLLTQRIFAQDANYIYTSTTTSTTSNQRTGTGLPNRVLNLTDSTRAGVTLTLTDSTSVLQVLKLASGGNFDLNNKRLRLLSSTDGTALVVNKPAGGLVTGTTATMERYIDPTFNPGRGYRYYSPPVAGATVRSLRAGGFRPVVNPSYNAASNPTPTNITPFPTVFSYNPNRLNPASFTGLSAVDKGLESPADSLSPLATGQGYALKVSAGDKVNFTGSLTSGTLPALSLTRNPGLTAANAGWNLVGNPYPSPLDWSLVAPADRLNLDAAIYSYVSTSDTSGFYTTYVNGWGDTPVIAAGQSFFVRVSDNQPSASLTFRNSQRVTSYAPRVAFNRTSNAGTGVSLAFFRTGVPVGGGGKPDTSIYMDALALPNAAGFSHATDAYRIPSTDGLNLSISAPNLEDELSIKALTLITSGTRVRLTARVPQPGTYTIRATTVQLPASSGLSAFLVDSVGGTTVNLSTQAALNFTITAVQAGPVTITNRFSLRFGPATPLPVELTAFTAALRGAAVALAWHTASEKNSARFEVERSRDGRNFERIGTVAAQGTTTRPTDYRFADEHPSRIAQLLYYRLRQVDRDGSASYSPVQRVAMDATPNLSLFPNPASGTATLAGATPGTLVQVLDALGREVATATADAAGSAALVLPRGLTSGLYVVRAGGSALRLTVE